MVQPHAVLELADGVLDLGVAAMIGLQLQGIALSVGDESVIAVVGEQRQLGAGGGFHPPHNEPRRRGVGLTLRRWSRCTAAGSVVYFGALPNEVRAYGPSFSVMTI